MHVCLDCAPSGDSSQRSYLITFLLLMNQVNGLFFSLSFHDVMFRSASFLMKVSIGAQH